MMVVVAARDGRTPPSSRRVQKLLSQQPLLQAAMLQPYRPHSCTVQLLCETPVKTCWVEGTLAQLSEMMISTAWPETRSHQELR